MKKKQPHEKTNKKSPHEDGMEVKMGRLWEQ
jgi:hypothetical protein